MQIKLASGRGTGPTVLAAFDRALLSCGVQNYNLIHLSSVIPPNTEICKQQHVSLRDEYGHRLYVVMAHRETATPGDEVWAGLGWVQEPGDGRGLFVEHTGTSEESVRDDINETLHSMMESREETYGPIRCELSGARCVDSPVSALVIAVYQAQGWD